MVSAKSRLASVIVAVLLIGLLSACGSTLEPTSQATFPVGSTFSDFYRELGGMNALGPAISAEFTEQGLTSQYVVAGLMVYDPGQMALRRFYFSGLASAEWHINGLVEPAPGEADTHYVNGHQIWEEIWTIYNRYGPDLIGLPVTGVIANDGKQRYEQYFEGLGFYRSYTETPGQVHLMPYGVWKCGTTCAYQISDSTPPSPTYSRQNSETEQLFLQASARLGYGYTGAPLAAPKLGPDGYYEMVFENAILFIDPSAGNQIRLRPLPEYLGIQTEAPGPDLKAGWLSFYPTQDGLGFSVPNTFSAFIEAHGGVEYSGNPMAEYHTLSDSGYSQCFTNLCLEYHPTAPRELRIRPHALGAEYITLGDHTRVSTSSATEALQIKAWEDNPLIPSGQSQGINIEATQNKTPVNGLKFSLVVTQPDGITKTYALSPTGDDGRTRIDLDPINGPNGAIVQYEICLMGDISPQICFSRSYSIWEP